MLIITGTGRCGTATLARMFNGHHEFRARYILDKYFLNADPFSNPFDSLKKRIEVMLDLHQGIDPKTFIDSSNLYIHYIDALFVLEPSVRIILSVRNGKDFVRSAISRKWHEQYMVGAVPPRDDPYFSRWNSMSALEKNAWIWVYRNSKALVGLKTVPDGQKLILRIEDIAKPEPLGMLEAFAGIRIEERIRAEKRVNANPSFDFPPKEGWSDEMNKDFDEIAGEMMKFFGYAHL